MYPQYSPPLTHPAHAFHLQAHGLLCWGIFWPIVWGRPEILGSSLQIMTQRCWWRNASPMPTGRGLCVLYTIPEGCQRDEASIAHCRNLLVNTLYRLPSSPWFTSPCFPDVSLIPCQLLSLTHIGAWHESRHGVDFCWLDPVSRDV